MANRKLEKFHYTMLLIRRFEERLLDLFSKGELSGTTHSYIGQEAIAVGVLHNLNKNDIHYYGNRPNLLGRRVKIIESMESPRPGRKTKR